MRKSSFAFACSSKDQNSKATPPDAESKSNHIADAVLPLGGRKKRKGSASQEPARLERQAAKKAKLAIHSAADGEADMSSKLSSMAILQIMTGICTLEAFLSISLAQMQLCALLLALLPK